MILISSQPSSKMKKRNVRVPPVGSMRAERKAKRVKSREEGEDALATADDLVGCTGEQQSAGDKTTSKDAFSQTDPRIYSLGGTCHCYSLSVTVWHCVRVMEYVSFASSLQETNSRTAMWLHACPYPATHVQAPPAISQRVFSRT